MKKFGVELFMSNSNYKYLIGSHGIFIDDSNAKFQFENKKEAIEALSTWLIKYGENYSVPFSFKIIEAKEKLVIKLVSFFSDNNRTFDSLDEVKEFVLKENINNFTFTVSKIYV